MDFYSNLFTKEEEAEADYHIRNYFSNIKDEDICCLSAHISKEEVRVALFEMGPSKASGVDGFNAFIFHNQ